METTGKITELFEGKPVTFTVTLQLQQNGKTQSTDNNEKNYNRSPEPLGEPNDCSVTAPQLGLIQNIVSERFHDGDPRLGELCSKFQISEFEELSVGNATAFINAIKAIRPTKKAPILARSTTIVPPKAGGTWPAAPPTFTPPPLPPDDDLPF